ncbi:hypothetical protein APE01nite_16260 [Acetobacter peroxydans]|uniref:Uncharacterized protein n=1 Tax=Acetobacter peroxydans TaxID=104098 RepID=A0A4Y3TWJ3_9PROT|nr:hypothetical protein AA0475_1778 [Acetobacter peroxydans]GEB85829.1 hypothetical protein APE01nite_16260 [Acetobacter peroxydans]
MQAPAGAVPEAGRAVITRWAAPGAPAGPAVRGGTAVATEMITGAAILPVAVTMAMVIGVGRRPVVPAP